VLSSINNDFGNFRAENIEAINGSGQDCQIFLGAKYQMGGDLPNYHKTCIPNGNKTYQMVVKYSKWPQNTPTISISKALQNLHKCGYRHHLATLDPGWLGGMSEKPVFCRLFSRQNDAK
jgi:hypothetical protein